MNIPAGGHAQPALQPGGQVGDDVAEHVVGHDYVELARVAHHLGAECVHVHVLGGDLGILFAYFLEYTLPQAPGVGHGVGLVAHEHTLARAAVPLLMALAILKSVADHALHAFAGVDVLLHRDLIERAWLEDAACAHIDALSVLAHHDKIDVL